MFKSDGLLAGGAGNDTYFFNLGDGVDTITDSGSGGDINTVRFGAGITADMLSLDPDAGAVKVGSGGDWIVLAGFNRDNPSAPQPVSRFTFGDGSVLTYEQLLGRGFDLVGTAGDDHIVGTGADDRINGGAGSDFIFGDAGADTYFYAPGDGNDTLAELDQRAPGIDTIRFTGGITAADLVFGRNGDGLHTIFFVNQPGDSIAFSGRIERFAFDDGSVWDAQQVFRTAYAVTGTAGDDSLQATYDDDYIVAGAGNDYVDASYGDDVILAGSGDDVLQGGYGSDTYVYQPGDGWDAILEYASLGYPGDANVLRLTGGITPAQVVVAAAWGAVDGPSALLMGNGRHDLITGSFSNLSLTFDDGTVWTGADLAARQSTINVVRGDANGNYLSGTTANDLFIGGEGNDYFDRSLGLDTFVFARGDGSDQVRAALNDTAGVLRLDAGITPGDLTLTGAWAGGINVLVDGGAGGSVAFEGWDGAGSLGRIEFDDGTAWDGAAIDGRTTFALATAGDDSLYYGNAGDVINALGGNDQITGAAGDDTIDAGSGDDYAEGDLGNDIIFGGAGADDLEDWNGSNYLSGGADNDYLYSDDVFSVLAGGAGADYVDGYAQQSLVLYNAGDGADWVTVAHQQVLSLGGLTLAQLTLGNDGNGNLVLGTGTPSDALTLGLGYQIGGGAWSLVKLQLIGTSAQAYDLGAVLLAYANDLAAGNDPGVVNLAAVLPAHEIALTAGTAYGGDVAVQYARTGIDAEVAVIRHLLANPATALTPQAYAIAPVNHAPEAGAMIGAANVNQDAALSFTVLAGAFTDADAGDTLTYGASAVSGGTSGNPLPAWLSFDPQTRTFSGTPGNADVGNIALRLTATDTTGLSASQDFTLTVNNVNDAPVAYDDTAALSDKASTGNLAAALLANDTDVDAGDTRAITAVNTAGTTGRVAFNANTQSLVYTADSPAFTALAAGQTATDRFGYTVADAAGAASSAAVTVTVTGVNDAPVVAQPMADVVTDEDSALNLALPAGAFTDPDAGDTLSWGASSSIGGISGNPLPAWLSFDPATRTFSGTPVNADVGNVALHLTATDGHGLSASQDFTLTVANVNDAPVLAAPLASRSLIENQGFSFALPANPFTDVDAGDTLTLTATLSAGAGAAAPLPAWLSFDPLTRTFSGVPDHASVLASAAGLGVTVTATDSAGASASGGFNIAVTQTVFTGTAGNDTISGSQYNDIIDGGAGADHMAGGAGNDTYIVDNTGDVVIESANQGNDTVLSSVTYTLGNNLENLTLTGTAAINANGNTQDNVLIGNDANNVLNGKAGADTMAGGLGNDTYVVDNAGDVVIENANEGTDTVQSSITYTLGANLERLTLTGTAAINGTGNGLGNILTGNAASNILTGLGGNDTLNGGAGVDTLIGGAGNDTYVVDNVGDVVIENAGEGVDLVHSSAASYTLSSNVENLTLTGTGANSGTGNELDNILTGNAANNTLSGGAGNDTLNGGAGSDTLIGGTGSDTYVVDNTGDVVVENAGEGIDQVNSSVTFTLATNVENLLLTGSAAIDGSGNELDNLLIGNGAANTLNGGAGNDVLDGKGGADILIGGSGNDTYVVNSALDVIVENAGEGIDQVNATATYTLGANLEVLNLSGTASISGTGNAQNNFIRGNAGNNTLNGAGGIDLLEGNAGADKLTDNAGTDNGYYNGGAGNDVITGGAGNEMIIGGAGNDTISTGGGKDVIAFNRGDGADILNASAGHDDTLSLGGGIGYADLALRKSSNDLILEMGAGESITMKNWYSTTVNGGDNKSVLNLQVIADAMSNFNANSNDPLLNKRVETFNFAGIVSAFDAQRLATPGLSSWALSSALLNFHLSGSDSAAIGGDLAYQYGHAGSNAGIGMQSAFDNLAAQGFGVTAQTLKPFSGLQEGLVKLA